MHRWWCAGGYNLVSGEQVFQIALNAGFANGIGTDGTHLYVTDFQNSQRRIFKVDPAAGSFTILAEDLPGQPNGIVHLPGTDELLVGFWGGNAAVRSYHRESGANMGNASTGLGNIDGIAVDCNGLVVFSTWTPARISSMDWGAMTPTITNLNVPGLNNPADIDFDAVNQRICIPNTGNHTVTLFDVVCSTDVPATTPAGAALQVLPNPARDEISIEPRSEVAQPYVMLDAQGRMIGGGTLTPGARLDMSGLRSGTYTMLFSNTGQRVRFVRE